MAYLTYIYVHMHVHTHTQGIVERSDLEERDSVCYLKKCTVILIRKIQGL